MPVITVYASRFLALLIVALHSAALLSLWYSDADALLRLLLAGAIVLLPVVRRPDPGTQRLSLGAGHCYLERSGSRIDLQPPQVRYLSEWLIILDFQQRPGPGRKSCRQRRFSMLFWPDSLSAGDQWQLRRYLENPRPDPFSVAGE